MRYISTRGNAEPKTFRQTLLAGLASDGGLYMPESYPDLADYLDAMRSWSYVDIAAFVLGKFAPDIPAIDLRHIIEQTYTAAVFASAEITPLRMLEPGLGLLKLSNGPTLAFKDVPLQLLGNLMAYELAASGDELNILGATSGDTGSAAAYALKGRKGLRLFMLSPAGRMSRFQQLQMYTLDEPNIFNLVVDGTFDDCQAVVKAVNADAEFRATYKLGAVNSINWARIAAQIVYYVYAYVRATTDNTEAVTFAVPSGNFGNALSAYIADEMGLPVSTLVCTNANDVLDQFFTTGVYRVRKGSDVKITSSPSMDIASASNFERFMFDYVDRDASELRMLWNQLAECGEFRVGRTEPGGPFGLSSGSADDAAVLETISFVYRRYGIIIDPHTAVAMSVVRKRRKDLLGPVIIAETAQPAKFPETILKGTGRPVPVPERFRRLQSLPEHVTRISPDPAAVKAFIASHV
jgi:threonine synthase